MRQPPKLLEFFHYPVTAGTALLAIGVTIAWMAGVDVSSLFESALIAHGEPWRLVTSIFPHVSIFHLFFNLYWLWVFGTLVEEIYGHGKTAALFFLFAVGSGALEYAFSDGGVGLSGVGYGLFGLLWILSKRDGRFSDAIDDRTVQLFIGWFFICIVTTYLNVMKVGNVAHGGGALLGILTAYAISQPQRRTMFAAGIAAVLVFGLWGSTAGRPQVNVAESAGYDEGRLGYDALVANHNQEAVRWFRKALEYRPNDPLYVYDMAIAYHRLGDMQASLAAYRKAAELGDTSAQNTLGEMLGSGRDDLPKNEKEALFWFRKAADQGNAQAQNSASWIYSTTLDPSTRNPTAALEYAMRAVNSEKGKPNPFYLDTLAEAYFVNDKFPEAIKTEQQALATLGDSVDHSEFQTNLEKYQRALRTGKQVPSLAP